MSIKANVFHAVQDLTVLEPENKHWELEMDLVVMKIQPNERRAFVERDEVHRYQN